MSIVPALVAIQISTMTSSSYRRGVGGLASSEPRTGFRSLGERGMNLKGWRYFLFSVLMIACMLFALVVWMAFIVAAVVVGSWIAMAVSPWTLLGTVPLAIAGLAGLMWASLRILI